MKKFVIAASILVCAGCKDSGEFSFGKPSAKAKQVGEENNSELQRFGFDAEPRVTAQPTLKIPFDNARTRQLANE